MPVQQKSIDNLNPPKKGEIRNPKGRPKGALSAKTIIAKWLATKENIQNPVTKKTGKMTQLDIITLKQLEKARKGDTRAFNALLDRTEGKPMVHIEASGPDGSAIPTEVKHTVTFKKMDGSDK